MTDVSPAPVDSASASHWTNRALVAVGAAYLALLPFSIPVKGTLYAHDPLVLLAVVPLLFQWRSLLKAGVTAPLAAFWVLAGTSFALHGFARADLYELAILGYMAVLFFWARQVKLPVKAMGYYGVAVLLVLLAAYVRELMGQSQGLVEVIRDFVTEFVNTRFQFRFWHANLAASFYAVPVAAVVLWYGPRWKATKGWAAVWPVAVLGVLCLPLAMTISKHMLLSLALIFGTMAAHPVFAKAPLRPVKWAFPLALGVMFVGFYATVLYAAVPFRAEFPFINTATPGMYTVHQKIYGALVLRDPMSFLFGLGREGVKAAYPGMVNHDEVMAILQQYHREKLARDFFTYMDAHIEYLNLSANFGVPAALSLFGVWFAAWKAGRARQPLLTWFLAATLLCCLWDDLMSKRWVWITFGLLSNPSLNPPRQDRSV
jgi:hypothetical protein